ncbi:MAG TPA: heparinase II/III family protein [Ensifer sp.]|nr:heparinase II/III family protein [Ensifer sp.]
MLSARLENVPDELPGFVLAPSGADRVRWNGLPADMRAQLVAAGDAALTGDWAPLPATLYLGYTRDGNRVDFETVYFARRRRLNDLILAECAEWRGGFLDAIVNGLWAIAEESGWQLPAHNSYVRGGARFALPDPSRPVIDLFAAETGALLAVALRLLGDALEKTAPGLVNRLEAELQHRIVTPYLTQHFWWMGNGDEPMNNWTIWCTQNVLWTIFALDADPQTRRAVIAKACGSIDAFLKDYGDDGACEEGAQYYRHAGLCLFNALATLSAVAPLAFGPVFQQPKIRNIAEYILNVHVAGRRYFNFADCAAICEPCGAREYLFGRAVGSEALTAFAAADWAAGGDPLLKGEINLNYRLQSLFNAQELAAKAAQYPEKKDIFYPSVGLLIARDGNFQLAVKAGDNGDSHNHNDVGSLTLYRDGRPFLIDVGVGTYTAKTFSPRRYEIWTMQSAFHNLPTFEGVMQEDGDAFGARDVTVELEGDRAGISMDIAGAYPAEAGIRSYRRTVRLIKGSHVEICDIYEGVRQPELSLMFAVEPQIAGAIIHLGELGALSIEGGGTPRVEVIAIDDARLRLSWPQTIYRVLIPFSGAQLTLRTMEEPARQ